jgi:hypothetical protein
MNTKVILTGAVALAIAAVTPAVIGRYGDEVAGLLRIDVLTGIGFVATLVALITLEYGRGAARAVVRQPVALRSVGAVVVTEQATTLVALRKNEDTRVAA